MIDLNAALCHHLFELPIADWIGHIPSNAPQDDIALELADFEIDHRRRTGRFFQVSLRALGKVSKFATEPYTVIVAALHQVHDIGDELGSVRGGGGGLGSRRWPLIPCPRRFPGAP